MAITRKKGSGRTKGATSLTWVKLEELNRILQSGATIPVGRVYAEQVGLKTEGNMVSSYANKLAAIPLQMQETQLDEELTVKSVDF